MCKDNNLKLVLVDEATSLGEKHSIGWDKDFDEFCRLNFGKTIELDDEINAEIERFLLSLDIPKPDLLQLEYLCLDADHAVYGYMTDDVLAHLDRWMIRSLEGIESCENLLRLDLNSMTQKVDLQPLTRLPKLEKLVMDSHTATHYEALLSIPNLKKLEIYNWVLFTPEDKRALALVLQKLEPRCELAVSASWKNSIPACRQTGFKKPKPPMAALQNHTNNLVQHYSDKLLSIRQQMDAIEEQQAGGKIALDFQSPLWTEAQMTDFEQTRKVTLPDEYKALLLAVGEINTNYFRNQVNLSLRNRLVKDYSRMKKKAIASDKIHPIGSLYGEGWIREDVFSKLKEEDKFRLYRKVPLFATDTSYDVLFRLRTWDGYKDGCLALNESTFLILNGEFAGEVWKYGSEPEGEYAPSKYRECFTPIDAKRPHLLEFILSCLTKYV